MENGYAICFNEWALDKEIKNELGLLLIISSLCAKKGYCFASNQYFSELFGIEQETISRKIKKLEEKKYISIEYEKRGCEIKDRKIRLTKISIDDYQKYQSTIDKKVKDNNTSINNTSINIYNNTIYDFVEQNFGRTLSPIEYEEITSWTDNELTRYAIKQAVITNKCSIKYISRILNAYERENIKTVQQAQEREREYVEAKKNKTQKKYKTAYDKRQDVYKRFLEDGE